ncbi:hypothetical protein HYV86_02700 [Candidatus Woesearchaeota archaeon]|nr:hypothetical protein [Candidatus Woesearchaeota archaeon]
MRYSPIIQHLLKPETVSLLETILEEDVAELGRIQKRHDEGKLPLGMPLSLEEYRAHFPQIKARVDDFLGVEGITTPQIRGHSANTKYLYFGIGLATMAGGAALGVCVDHRLILSGFLGAIPLRTAYVELQADDCEGEYRPNKMQMVELERSREQLLPIVGHEYVHHVQWQKGLLSFNPFQLRATQKAILTEGHACGVQRHLARQYAQEEDNEVFIYHNLTLDITKLKRLYTWLCKERQVTVRPEFQQDGFKPHLEVHAVGLGYFLTREMSEGSRIYADWIAGGNPLLE